MRSRNRLLEQITPFINAAERNIPQTSLRGYPLVIVRGLCLLIMGVYLYFLAVNLPALFALLHTPCPDTTGASCNFLQLRSAQLSALAHYGFSLHEYALYALGCDLLMTVLFLSVGLLIFWYKSTERMGIFVSLLLIVFGADGVSLVHNVVLLPFPVGAVTSVLGILQWPALGFLFYTFPDGRFVPRWSWLLSSLFLLQAGFFLLPFPYTITNWPWFLALLDLLVVYGSALATQFYRYRVTASPQQRLQIKWLLFGVTLTFTFDMVLNLLPLALPSLTQHDSWYQLVSPAVLFFAYLPIPLGIGIALLLYRLWDIDILINRTLVYVVLSACVIGLYVLLVGYIGALFQTPNNSLISLIATALVAIIFQPLRSLLQRAANRLFYGERDVPYQILARLDQQLALARPAEEVLPTLVKTVATALKLPYVAIALLPGDASRVEERVVARHGQSSPHAPTEHLPLVYQGETVGQLVFTSRAGEAQLTSADRRALEDLAHHAGVIAHAVRLTADLRRSRERLVVAREEERRRLRRDLHDGLGPMMASLTLTLAATREYLGRDPATADELLQEMAQHLQGAVGDIRRLVYDLRPPTLDDLGLLGALREQVIHYSQGGLRVTLEAQETLEGLPAAVEVAAYRIVMEAMTNVVRHAQASMCILKVQHDSNLIISISDDGCGLPATVDRGIGMRSMRERAEELGGTWTIEARPEGGTVVRACLPLMEGQHEYNQ